ncbi:MATE family efflux transporter [Telmatospirillum sp. J64-1]|uniref:MATE family efflux transporter n=1 Tax=Telmatospirillum sp. J64-1 TaxID=2502183 RepID=UPI002102BCAB|nr:MATE family efflux transporter [Telmatospirillum sp. J64-1]
MCEMDGVAVRRSEGGWGREIRAMLSLAWPLVLANLAQIAINTTDVVMMGWLGPQDLAAGTLGSSFFFVFFITGMGVMIGTAPLMAQALGRRRHAVRDVRRTVRQGFWVAAIMSLPVWLVLNWSAGILPALGQDAALSAKADEYIHYLKWSIFFGWAFVVLRSFVSALERPRAAFVVTFLAIGLNAFVNWLLMFGNMGAPALGLAGAGIATTITNLFMFSTLLGFILLDRQLRRFYILGRLWRSDWARCWEIVKVGGPIGGIFALEMGVFSAAVFLMGLIGADALAANAIALQVVSITFMVPMGIGQAATVRVGLGVGRGDPLQTGRAGWAALAMSVLFMAMMAVLLVSMPRLFVSPFLDLSDPEARQVARLAAEFLALAGLFQVVDGAQTTAAGALRGLKDTRMPMVFAGIGYWVLGLPCGALLAFWLGLGGVGVWGGLALGLSVVAGLMTWRWARRETLGLV